MRTLDALFSGWRWWRRLRGGKWERTSPCCALPVYSWWRVDVFRPGFWPRVVTREDYRGKLSRVRGKLPEVSAALPPQLPEGSTDR